MTVTYESWLKEVNEALASINMHMADWQSRWTFDFTREFSGGTSADDAAVKANKFWWHHQNKAWGQDCQKTPNCWLIRNHQGECQPLA